LIAASTCSVGTWCPQSFILKHPQPHLKGQ
jgi:hypothetical protein